MAAQSPASTSSEHQYSIIWFAATTLLGAFLVFQVQPIISKCVLPWFGGTPAVWTTCMLFFQLLLFAGYLYAHFLRTFLSPAVQGAIHLALLSAAALMLPIEPSDAWKPMGSESPTPYLLWMLAAHVGLPYFVLSSTGPLLQAWLSYHDSSDRVYRLYALSNAGSLAALLSYPFVVEPVLSVSNQSLLWSLMFCGFVLVQGVSAIGLFRVSASREDSEVSSVPEASGTQSNGCMPTRTLRLAWLALPALASTTLLVTTNHVCQDIAVVPFLWVLPLSLYLISFIVCFDSPQWYTPKWISTATLIAIATIHCNGIFPNTIQLVTEASSYMLMLLGICLLCHGEVARIKPRSQYLTQYYALLSAGGAIGGLVVAVLCPMLLSGFTELPFTLSLATVLAFLMFVACRGWRQTSYEWSAARRMSIAAIVAMIASTVLVAVGSQKRVIASERNFFGVLQVQTDDLGIRLVHGNTNHGMQRFGARANEPTTYFGLDSGIGRTFRTLQQKQPELRIGIVGLGCGVLASYGRAPDRFDIIEINPAVISIAQRHFTFMRDCPAHIETHLGDGRLVLERMTETKFDLLILDAFSSDAIPAHLLTREAIALYRQRLAEGGMLAIHVSNKHLDLAPLVHRLSADAGLASRLFDTKGDAKNGLNSASWMLIGEKTNPNWNHELLANGLPATPGQLASAPLWTDQCHNLLSVLRLW